MNPTRAELKITVAKLLELAYSEDKGVTAKIMYSKGPFKLSVDQDGNAKLSGSAGILTFSGSAALEAIGAKLKYVSVSFTQGEGKNINYHASFDLKVAKLAVSGSFNLEELITACSGLLCRAARALKGRQKRIDDELQRIMGH